jgi:hypothetical protein
VGQCNACFGVWPSGDLIKFFHADWHTAKWQVDIGASCCGIRTIAIKVTKSVEVARLDRSVRRIKFFDGGAFARTESFNERTCITLPRLRG